MLNPKNTYNLSKTGWEYATKIDVNPLTEVLLIEALIKDYGEVAYLPGFIKKTDCNPGVYLDGDVYLILDQYFVYYHAFQKNLEKFTKHIFRLNYRYIKNLLKTAKEVSCYKNFKVLSNKELLRLFKKFIIAFKEFSAIADTPFMTDYALSRLLIEEFLKQGLNKDDASQLVFQLGAPLKISQAGKEKDDLEKIAKFIRQTKKLINSPEVSAKIKKHWQKYSWLGMCFFSGQPFSLRSFQERVKGLLASINVKERTKEKKIKFKSTPKINLLIRKLCEICYLRTWRLEMSTFAIYLVLPLLEEIARRFGLSYQELIYLTHREIISLLSGKKFIYRKIIRERKGGFGVVFDDKFRIYVITGEILESFKKYFVGKLSSEKFDEIKGASAYPGKIKGTARIINNTKEFKKFRPGDVLVTQMTTSDFVIIIEKARAIITDIGGVTCHAAIVSRELNIPCIVGTKIATKVLRDGQLVEVDANKGMVKILKNKK